MDMAEWLQRAFPAIRPTTGWQGAGCWLAFMMTRSVEHNPPYYWLSRALESAGSEGAGDELRDRLHRVHGSNACAGDRRDVAVQDVLTEVCASAWAAQHIAIPERMPARETGPATGALLHIARYDAWIAPRRIRPQRSMQDLLQTAIAQIDAADAELPAGRARIVYLDTWHDPMYAQGVGYRLELTEPLEHAVHHYATDRGLGYVLTRPFQWGNPLAAYY